MRTATPSVNKRERVCKRACARGRKRAHLALAHAQARLDAVGAKAVQALHDSDAAPASVEHKSDCVCEWQTTHHLRMTPRQMGQVSLPVIAGSLSFFVTTRVARGARSSSNAVKSSAQDASA